MTTTSPARRNGARRADARRNAEAILLAAAECLAQRPEASVNEIAQHAGVGRITLYGHYASRSELVEAVLVRALADGDAVLESVDLTGDPAAALARLVAVSWRLVDRSRSVLAAAQRELAADRIRALHGSAADRVTRLLRRGRREGIFRDDLPLTWMTAVMQEVVHGAATEVDAGRLAEEDAAVRITTTLLAAFTPPGGTVPATPTLP